MPVPPTSDDAGTENSRIQNEGPEGARSADAGSRPDFERVQTDDAPGHEARSYQTPEGVDEGPRDDDPPEDHYEPDPVEVTRAREQGLGMGARDLQLQRDAQRPVAPPEPEDAQDGE
jgi:hypothetical protein